ncbi:lipocalin family protein [Chitinophaga horti]|uniref:Lipocalin family protein n=1 Tax=Chitinophaga horti TaxID=2920382 RepID=A0ABY6IZB0_9BACT|nr:lipocalin family protein [Chitinophaga horti]UYQ91247.1 lipocalin family protein [Chitinophaga horti]
MKNTLTCAGLLAACMFTASACKKDDNKTQTAHEKNVALITDRNWNIAFNGYDNNGDGVLDYNYMDGPDNSLAACIIDDEWEFRSDSTFFMRLKGEDNCATEDGGPFPWSLSKDSKTINYSGTINNVLLLNDTAFQFSQEVNGETHYTHFRRAKK